MALTFQEVYDKYTDITKDTEATNVTRGKDFINDINSMVLGLSDRFTFTKKERTATSVASQQDYQLPVDYGRLLDVWVVVGGVTYYLDEVVDQEYWRSLNTTSVSSDITNRFMILEDKIYLYPTPSSTGVTLHILYRKQERELTQADYTTGTIATTSASATVTGTGTTWTSAMIGRFIQIDGLYYEISAVASTTSLTLVKPSIITKTSATYKLGEMSSLPGEFHDVLWRGAVADFYDFKGDANPWRDNFEKRVGIGRYKNLPGSLLSIYGGGNESTKQVIRRVNRNRVSLSSNNDYPTGLS